MTLCVERAAICVKEIFSNQLTQKRRALPLGCSGRSLRSSDATEARQSDRARTKTRARPPICGLRRPVGVPNSPVSWRRKTPDTTKSDSRPSEPARLASSWPTRKAPRASRGPAGHQRRGAHHSQSRDDDNRDIRETYLNGFLTTNGRSRMMHALRHSFRRQLVYFCHFLVGMPATPAYNAALTQL